ncbi:MAG TPA: saccharopine dehydrogenase NADP-binding domain-containing protein [Chitinophagaceae bacterium]|nr:saccharopine dehydrogenase NADP-binding domain-containing protein [Chitinophagaceae bacterium]
MDNSILLYGANGYTGTLITRMAADYGIRPILAGRSEENIKPLAEQFGYAYRIADLNDATAMDKALSGIKVVLHAAGPFRFTAKPMVEACIRNGVHYLDITGEIMVYEMAKKYSAQAAEKGIMLMPGVGFDVVPTDCIALSLKKKMPDATSLKLAFAGLGGSTSRGTSTSMAQNLGRPSAVRKDGKITPVPLGHKSMWLDHNGKKIFVMSIPWGDVSTAFSTTGIPNIETYTSVPSRLHSVLKFQSLFNWILRTSFAKNYVMRKIKSMPPGPSDEKRARSKSVVWGEAMNDKGDIARAKLQCAEGYTLTAISSLIIAKKVLAGNFKPGYQTPAGCYGEKLVEEIPGTMIL